MTPLQKKNKINLLLNFSFFLYFSLSVFLEKINLILNYDKWLQVKFEKK